MERITICVFTLLVLPLVLAASPYRKDATFCQEEDASCKMSSGSYGCCPAVDGVCCDDEEYCCSRGFKCDLSAKQCLQYGDPSVTEDLLHVLPIGAKAVREVIRGVTVEKTVYRMVPFKPLTGDVGDVNCPGGDSSCDNGETCCLGDDNQYACCPEVGANCCDDYTSCCPSGTVCDVINSNCITPQLRVLDRIPFLAETTQGK